MDCIESWCPSSISHCIRMSYVYLFKKLARKEKSYDGLNELQQQQFRISNRHQKRKNFETQEDHLQKPSNISLHDQIQPSKLNVEMEVKLLLNQQSYTSKPREMNILEQQKTNENDINYQPQQKFEKFKINIDPFSPYYPILQEPTRNLKEYFQFKGQQLALDETNSGLKIYQCQNKNGKLVFQYTYKLPCSYSYYATLMNNHSGIFKQFNNLIDQYSLIESIQPNLRLNYLSFNKFTILQPREFVYLKYSYGLDSDHWEVCLSHDDKYHQQKQNNKKVLGSLFCVSHLKQISLPDNDCLLQIKSYLEIDIKSNVKAQKAINKALMQTKNYIETLHEYIKNSFQEQLA